MDCCEVGLAAATAEPVHPGGASSVGFFWEDDEHMGIESDWTSLQKKTHHPGIPSLSIQSFQSSNPFWFTIWPEKTSPDCQDFSLRAPSGTGLETSKLPMQVLAPAPVTNEPMPGTSEGPRCDRGALRVSMCRTCRAGCACGTRWTKPSRLPESMCFGDFARGWCLDISQGCVHLAHSSWLGLTVPQVTASRTFSIITSALSHHSHHA